MKKILEVAYPALNNSGVPAVIMGIVRELHNECKFDVLVFRSDIGYHKEEFESYGGKIHIINCDKKKSRIKNIIEKITRPFKLYQGTKKILSNDKFDVIHCHNGADAGWCILAAQKCGVPLRIVHSHSSANSYKKEPLSTRVYQLFMRSILNKYSTNRIGCSRIAADSLFGKNAKTQVVLNAVDLSRFNKNIINYNINTTAPTVLFVGRITMQKNPIFLLNVFKSLQNYLPNAKLKIIGYGDMEETVRNEICNNRMKNVTLMKHSSDVPNVLAESDVFILPSFYEGLPIVLVEAQTMGVHCFASDTIAMESDMGNCDFLPLTIGADEWAKKIYTYLSTTKIKKMPEEQITNRYNWKTIANDYRTIYKLG
jgi:glycosyltransferase EpsF